MACPDDGPLAAELQRAGVPRIRVPAFEASFRPDPVHTPAGITALCAGGIALAWSARRLHAEVLYANTPRAGLMGVVARLLGGPPLVVRVHDHLPSTMLGRTVRLIIARSANAVLAVSDHTAQRFNEGLSHPVARRVYNGIDHSQLDPLRVTPAPLRAELGIDADALLLGQVAQITPWKGQDDAIRILGELRRGGLDAHLVLVGGITFDGKQVRYDNAAYLRELHRLVDELGVTRAVHFLGHRADVPAIFRALDLSLLPSWDEPFANVAIESMAMGTPTFVTDVGGLGELVEDGVSGRVLPPRRPGDWAKAVRSALRDRRALERMGARARAAAVQFSGDTYAREIEAYLRSAARESRSFGADHSSIMSAIRKSIRERIGRSDGTHR